MTSFGKFATASAAALTLSATTSALAGSSLRNVVMDCAPGEPVCDALGDALRHVHTVDLSFGAAAVTSSSLVVRFEATRQGAQALAGFLIWRDGAGQTGRGPEIELSVIDTNIQPEMLAEFARQLVANSPLPL